MKINILVVDDEPDIKDLILARFDDQISNNEMDFVFAQNGLQALEVLKTTEVNLIMTDINMPEMDGITFLSHVSTLHKSYKAIVISAYGDMSNIRAAMNKGAVDFITKPIDFRDLEMIIKKVYDQHCQHKEMIKLKEDFTVLNTELTLARAIQESMIPSEEAVVKYNEHRYEFAGLMKPAKDVGGDFFDYFDVDATHQAFIIGDVSGKGISGAFFMAIARTLFRAMGRTQISPRECIQSVNDILAANNNACMFVTVFYGVLNTETGEFSYFNAGHLPPVVIRKNGTVHRLEVENHVPVGLAPSLLKNEDKDKHDKTILLQEDETLILYTDGVVEAFNTKQEEYGAERFLECLEKADKKNLRSLLNKALVNVQEFAQGAEQSDDITILGIQHTGVMMNGKAKEPDAVILREIST